MIQLPPLARLHFLRKFDIGFEYGGAIREHVDQLGPNFRGGGLDRIEPRKNGALIELDGGQAGEMHEGRLLPENRRLLQHGLETALEALQYRPRMARPRVLEPLLEKNL